MINLKPRIISYVIRPIPNFLWILKWYIIFKSLRKAGKNFRFGYDSEFFDHRLIEVGDNVFMGLNTVINTSVPVTIGDDVMFGRSVTIIGGDHNFNVVGKQMRYLKSGGANIPIEIENDVWVGSNVTILKGVRVGEGAIIGAGSVVTKSIAPYSINVGNPCKRLKMRFSIEELEQHLKLINSKYKISDLIQLYD